MNYAEVLNQLGKFIFSQNGMGGMRQTASLYSIDASNTAMAPMALPVAHHRENELKITKEQDILALQRKVFHF